MADPTGPSGRSPGQEKPFVGVLFAGFPGTRDEPKPWQRWLLDPLEAHYEVAVEFARGKFDELQELANRLATHNAPPGVLVAADTPSTIALSVATQGTGTVVFTVVCGDPDAIHIPGGPLLRNVANLFGYTDHLDPSESPERLAMLHEYLNNCGKLVPQPHRNVVPLLWDASNEGKDLEAQRTRQSIGGLHPGVSVPMGTSVQAPAFDWAGVLAAIGAMNDVKGAVVIEDPAVTNSGSLIAQGLWNAGVPSVWESEYWLHRNNTNNRPGLISYGPSRPTAFANSAGQVMNYVNHGHLPPQKFEELPSQLFLSLTAAQQFLPGFPIPMTLQGEPVNQIP